jgi:DNA-binding GntR family transcriptional regulator
MIDARPKTTLLPEAVYDHLRQGIVSGRIPGGAALSVPRLAADLGVGRSPVREGIQRLIAEELAVHVPYAGARVRSLEPDDAREVFAVREVLDGLAARLAAAGMSADEVAALGEVLAEQERNLAEPVDQGRDAALDLAFHGAIRAGSGNRTLDASLERIETIAHLRGSALWTDPEGRRSAVREHRDIWEALAAGDPDRAAAAATAHVRAVAKRVATL